MHYLSMSKRDVCTVWLLGEVRNRLMPNYNGSVCIAGCRARMQRAAGSALSPGRAAARQPAARGARGRQAHVPGVPSRARRPALTRARAQAVARARSETAVQADGGDGSRLPRSRHRPQRSQTKKIRLRRLSKVRISLFLTFKLFLFAGSQRYLSRVYFIIIICSRSVFTCFSIIFLNCEHFIFLGENLTD